MPLDVAGTATILLVGGGETAQGRGVARKQHGRRGQDRGRATSRSLSAAPIRPVRIPLPADEVLATSRFGDCRSAFGMEPFTAPGEYAAHVDLDTSVGAQSIPAVLVVVANAQVAVLCEQPVFTRSSRPTTRSRPRPSFATSATSPSLSTPIADEPLFEVAAGPTPARRRRGRHRPGATRVQPGRDRARCSPSRSPPHRRSNRPRGRRSASTSAFRPALDLGLHVRALPRHRQRPFQHRPGDLNALIGDSHARRRGHTGTTAVAMDAPHPRRCADVLRVDPRRRRACR